MIDLAFKLIVIFIISYLIGSIPTGYIIVKLLKNIDIREVGSGSIGATNVKRVLGTKWFFIVMFLDALKGFLPVYFVIHHYNFHSFVNPENNVFYEIRGLSPVTAALALLIGHSKSVFLTFTGGKSVATGVGTIFALSFPVGLITAVIWGIITYFTKYVSVGSIVAVSLTPILMRAVYPNDYYVLFTAICAVYVIIKHKDNIKRLVKGTENKVRGVQPKKDNL